MVVRGLFLISMLLGLSQSGELTISQELSHFIGTLEQYMNTANDVIFLLDESGSITKAKYPEVKHFTELTARHLAVSADKSRVAVISFSDYPRIHINYIKDSAGNNMCTLIKKIHAMDYIGSGTATRLAMEKSREVFAQARRNSTKIIVLITDGKSNSDSNPESEAIRLKREGVVIFAIGVADVNTKEIEAVASSRNHIYILEDFDYLKKVNEHLVKAIREVSWDYVQDTSLCNKFCDAGEDCCDDHAHCYCGTIGGAYECNCGPGYAGTGHKHGCHECPKGTYKVEVGNKNCTLCPKHATTKDIGSAKASDCICDIGYEWHGNYCKAIECARLLAPPGGITIPSKCDNTYGKECKVKCKEGYCPYSCNFLKEDLQNKPWDQFPLQTRTCLITGKWSGNDFKCEKMRCPELEQPLFGRHNCSGSDFSFGTTCSFQCELGYQLRGSIDRGCLSNGSWSGVQTQCLVKYCDPLKINQHLMVRPKKCSAAKMPFGSVCVYHCGKGYSLTSKNGINDGINECLANETWSGIRNQIFCEDISPPSIKCPRSRLVETDPSKSTASVIWDLPIAEDNIFVKAVHIKEPKLIRKPPYSFPIGSTKIVYEVTDSVDLSNTCSFNITVIDKEPPSVLFCPSDIEIFSEKNAPLSVTWEEPKFQDNSGKYHLTPPNKQSGDEFTWASRDVISYNISDPSGNKAFCNFTVIVKPYPCPYFEPPENGMVTCDKWELGRLCSVACKEGYEFASKFPVPSIFECLQSGSSVTKKGSWVPFSLLQPGASGYQMPVPDCSKKQKRSALDVSLQLNYTVDDCSDEVINKMKEKFLSSLKPFDEMLPNFFCHVIDGINSCRPENVHVDCISSKSKQKRSTRLRRDTENILVVSLDFKLQLLENKNEETPENSTSLIAKKIEAIASNNVRDVYNLPFLPEPSLSYNVTVICLIGQLRINNTCVNCPAGTYKDDISGTCIDCPSSTYQDKENSLSCLPCPEGYTTYQERSKHFFDCKAPCQPGWYSKTSFEPCFPCPLNSYQTRVRSQECTKCPTGLQTWKASANSSTDCLAPCNPGSHSDTGLEPCNLCDFGFYQDKAQQKLCSACPENTSTRKQGSKVADECEEMNICAEIAQCASGSTCIPEGNDYTCICAQGFFGKNCEETSNYCESDYCLNNGTCVKKSHGLECLCIEGFSGIQCEINIDDCKKGLCGNGECKDLINGYKCICPVGYTGSSCQVNINDCIEDPCFNGGTCFDKLNGYKCCCPQGYTGVNCEAGIQPIDACDSSPCFNDGICSSNETHFSCSCPSGYDGIFCESDINECLNETCFNGGTCIDGNGLATCECPLLFDGNNCETVLLPEYSLSYRSPTTANYAEMTNSKRLSAVTVSFFMRTNFKEPQTRPTAFSYGYYDEDADIVIDNGLTLFDTNRLILYIHNELLHTGYAANKDFNWHHYVILWERKNGKWSFFVDGNTIVEGSGVGKDEYMWPGMFVLGQEQDSIGGTFSTPEAFVGDITEFNVWDYILSENEIKQLHSKCGFIGNVISWFQFSTRIHGNIVISKDVDLCKNAGTCLDESCHCLYSTNTKDKCKYQVKSCTSNPCQNSQTCLEDNGQYYCNCSSGYDGKFCDYDINECLDKKAGCSHYCVNTHGSYKCTCPENMTLAEDGFTCKDTSFCEENGQVFLDGQVWMQTCKECLCDKSKITCFELQCKELKCQPEENLVFLPGDCCPKCVLYSFCLVSPNNTISNFEYSQMEIKEDCGYSLVEDCINANFKVESLERNLIVYESCRTLRIAPKGNVSLDGGVPFKNEFFEVKSNNLSIEVWTKSGLYVHFYIDGEILLALPSHLTDSACGICANVQDSNVVTSSKYDSDMKNCLLQRNYEDISPFINPASLLASGQCYLFLLLVLHCLCNNVL